MRVPTSTTPPRYGVLEVVALGVEAGNPREDGRANHGGPPSGILLLGDDAGPDLHLVPDPEHALQDGPPGHAPLQVGDVLPRLVDVEAADDDEPGHAGEVPDRHGDPVHQVLADEVDVVLEHGGYGQDGRGVRHGPHDELAYLLLLRQGRVHLDQVDLVLQDDDVLEAHDLHGGEVLGGLGLGAGLVPGHEEEGAVHHRGAVEHGGHEDVVAGTVHEGDVTAEVVGHVGLGVGERVGVGGAPGCVHGVARSGD